MRDYEAKDSHLSPEAVKLAGIEKGLKEYVQEDWDNPEYIKRKAADPSYNPQNKKAKKEPNYNPSNNKGKKGGNPNRPQPPAKGRRRKKKKHPIIRLLVVLGILFCGIIGLWYLLVHSVHSNMNYTETAIENDGPMTQNGVTNILLIGTDNREGVSGSRSDAMMLLSICSEQKKIYLTSFLRDIYVDIPGREKGNRLNAAYSYGGASLLMDTIEQNFDIPVNDYVTVDFAAFAALVDAVGGVDISLTSEEIELVNGYLVEYNIVYNRPEGTDYMDTTQSGMVHLNGPQALAYCRNRTIGTDFGRTQRQRDVIAVVMKQLPNAVMSNPAILTETILPQLSTNLSDIESMKLSFMALSLTDYEIVEQTIPVEGTYEDATIREMAVLSIDFAANIDYLKKRIYGE